MHIEISLELVPFKGGKLSKFKTSRETSKLKEVKIFYKIYQTNKQIREKAKKLGMVEVNGYSHGDLVFYNKSKGLYFSHDNTSHNGGYWKGATTIDGLKTKETRSGTYDEFLNYIGK